MTPLDKYLIENATELAKDDAAAERTTPTTLEQRIAIGLVQARALECRHLAGQLQIYGLTRIPQIRALWAYYIDRSSKLEAIGLEMCEKYPPDHEPERQLVEIAQPLSGRST